MVGNSTAAHCFNYSVTINSCHHLLLHFIYELKLIVDLHIFKYYIFSVYIYMCTYIVVTHTHTERRSIYRALYHLWLHLLVVFEITPLGKKDLLYISGLSNLDLLYGRLYQKF